MESCNRSPGEFRDFKKGDFEVNWIKLAECTFGQLYQVKLKLWREKCVLKCFDTTLYGTNIYRRIVEAASVISKVKFKYILSMYGLCSEASAVVMEHMSQGSLNNLLSSHTLMWPKKFQMIYETSMGMNFLHTMKPPLLHLNLKTSNILLDDHLHVRISDFGLIHWEEGTSKKTLLEHLTARGNINYIPPELFTQSSDAPGTPLDVYSFAIVMWEILTQQKPYPGCSVTTVILQVSHGKRPSMEMLPDEKPPECGPLIGIMQQCWDQDHRKRPHFAETVMKTEALNEVLKIPGPVHCPKIVDKHLAPDYSLLVPPIHKIVFPQMSSGLSADQTKDNILGLLSRKDFGSFRQSLRKEHVYKEFSGKKRLLHFTVASGDIQSVEHVLSLGADVNCMTARGYTPLIIAVLHRLHDIVSLLMEHGALVTQGDEDEWTPIHFAAQNGDDRTLRLLLDNGAVADAREKSGWTPLHLACQNGHESAVRLLLTRLSQEALGEQEETRGRTALHLASSYGHLNIVKLLLSQGADANVSDHSLCTPLHLSAEEGHFRVVRQLVKSGASTNSADSRGLTALHLSALKSHTGICRQLLSAGSDPESRTLQGWTAMHLAALRGHEGTVAQLEKQGGSVNTAGENGWTPLHLACYQNKPEVVEKLLAARADPNISEESEGWTPLHVACMSVSLPCVLHLITHKADVNAVNLGKATPLHIAARHGCAPIVKALLLNGADKRREDSTGFTALSVAQSCGNWEIVQLLLE
ncbi:ankyrin repeat and protein kinase domain-containing protein 1 [Cynoglossus semilaevis]|uniref:Ankyrin repeat and kinase domain containing 1 n=1 Tax=Cynoglossus semilaevis TaxID=244447 RepID=A0A3P8WK64_CYNSE|nr:ankyrin repeat and protein kinase domain-containing protein 1 [Cynoglossus semilaevis]